MKKVKLVLEYDGTNFCGWQRQRENVRSVQGALEDTLRTFIISERKKQGIPESDEFPVTQASGRTDSGVHARGQVVSFAWPGDLPPDMERLHKALNGMLPPDIAVRGCESAPEDFDARFTPHNKQYFYRILHRDSSSGLERGRALVVRDIIDLPAMIEGARLLRGKRDFSSFRAIDCIAKTTERTLYLSEVVRVDSEEIRYVVQGNGFLKQMIRIVVGTLLDVGRGKSSLSDLVDIIEAKDRNRAGETAPACGLYLDWVKYSE